MSQLSFEWDPEKASANLKKHGVSFEEARSVFYDEWAVLYGDPDHSVTEDRFLLIGISARLNTVLVSHCYRESERSIRIISARKADQSETEAYWRQRT